MTWPGRIRARAGTSADPLLTTSRPAPTTKLNSLDLGGEFNLRFPGQYRDAETGLFYNYFRDYDPQTGRYVQSDPIGLEGGLNTYLYVDGNPLSYLDPAGLEGSTAWGWLRSSGLSLSTGSVSARVPLGCVIRVSLKQSGGYAYAGCGVVVGTPSFSLGPNIVSGEKCGGPSGFSYAWGGSAAPLIGPLNAGSISGSAIVSPDTGGAATSVSVGVGRGVSLFGTAGYTWQF
jgi:RHS repeat-associated protein